VYYSKKGFFGQVVKSISFLGPEQCKRGSVSVRVKVENVASRGAITAGCDHLPTPVAHQFSFAPLYDSIYLSKGSGNFSGMGKTFTETYGAYGLLQLHQL
jgi:hypothetical protein